MWALYIYVLRALQLIQALNLGHCETLGPNGGSGQFALHSIYVLTFMVYQMSNLDIVSNLIVAMLLLNSDNGPPKEMLTTCTVFLWSSCNPAAWTGRESGSKFRHIILIEQPSGSIYRPNGLTHPQRAPRTRPICVILRSSMAQTSIFM
jgi:hypothetical protein